MELVFESEGPVLRDRLTKKKVKYYDRQNIRFAFRAEKIDFRDIPPDVTTFDRSPCTIIISSDWGHSPVLWLFYNTTTKNPIYAETYNSFWKLEVK